MRGRGEEVRREIALLDRIQRGGELDDVRIIDRAECKKGRSDEIRAYSTHSRPPRPPLALRRPPHARQLHGPGAPGVGAAGSAALRVNHRNGQSCVIPLRALPSRRPFWAGGGIEMIPRGFVLPTPNTIVCALTPQQLDVWKLPTKRNRYSLSVGRTD